MVQKQRDSETLHPDCLYLDTTSSFNQAFVYQHLDEVKRVVVSLRVNCNTGVSRANEKGCYGDIFNMLLVRNGIAKLLSVPQLECDGFVLTYDTRTTWHTNCPDGKVVALDRELGGVCDRFCCIYMSQPLNQSDVSLVNTVCKKY